MLSGGGARGFAHVGVLRVLEELNVPVDMVIGVSMGAVVGGAYAAGRSVERLEQFVRRTDWDSIVADRPPRDDLAFRRRQDDLLVPSRIEFGVSRQACRCRRRPPATPRSSRPWHACCRPARRDQPVNRLPLPFRTVASDLLTGELVELNDTPLFMSMRASLSVPGVFAPVRVNDRLRRRWRPGAQPAGRHRARDGRRHRHRRQRGHAAGRRIGARQRARRGAADAAHPDRAERAALAQGTGRSATC